MARHQHLAIWITTIATIASADQSLIGLRLDGPDQVIEGHIANYHVIAQLSNGTEIETTLCSKLDLEPGINASLDDSGQLQASAVSSNQVETLRASFVFHGTLQTANKTITILHVPIAGFALRFDGVNDYVKVPRSASLEPPNELTVEAWIRPNSVGAYHNRIVRKAGDFQPGYILTASQNGDQRLQLRIDAAVAGNVRAIDPTPFSNYVGTWHHVAGVYSVSGNLCHLFVDGVLKASTGVAGHINYSNSELFIGNFGSNPNEGFDGLIDEVRLWSLARSQQQIIAYKNRRLVGNETGLVGYWRFDEGVNQVVSDSSLSGNNGFRGFNSLSAGDTSDPTWVISDAPNIAAPDTDPQ